MKRILLTIMMIALLTMSLSGCLRNESSHWDTAVRVWDKNHPYDSFDDRYFSITIAELDNAKLEYKKADDGVTGLYLNDKLVTRAIVSLYLIDLTNDGYPELCLGWALGSGIVNYVVSIYDMKNEVGSYQISDRMNYDYYLFSRDGVLCIKEISYIGDELTRTGAVVYEGGEVSVAWDSRPDASFDKTSMIHIGKLDIRSDIFILLITLIALAIQIALSLKIKLRSIRFAPLCLSLLCVAVFGALAIIFDGWDAVGFLIFTVVSAAIAAGCGIGIATSAIIQKKKAQSKQVEKNSLLE